MIETELIVKVNGEVIYRDSALGENGLESIVEKSYRIPQQIKNYNALKNPMNIQIPVTEEEAGDHLVKLNKEENLCQTCESPLSGPDSDQPTTVCSNCI